MKRKYILLLFVMAVFLSYSEAQNYRIGDLFVAPDGSSGIVYYLNPDGSGGLVVALQDASEGCAWGTNVDIPALVNQNPTYMQTLMNDTSGYSKTQTLRNYQNNNISYAAGKVAFSQGWFLPSVAQLRRLYSALSLVESALVQAGGSNLLTDSYWSSSERDATNAWTVSFETGSSQYKTKSSFCRVRAVRSFTYVDNPASEVTYLWSTGETTPDITVAPTQTTAYTVTVTSPGGCADTVEQTIVVNGAAAQIFYAQICQGATYQDNGFDISATETSQVGTFPYYKTTMISGCEVTDTLNLTILPAPYTNIMKTACDNYEWNGVLLTESGTYTQTFPLQTGCDSVVTMNLTITQLEAAIYATDSVICSGDSVMLSAIVTNAAAVAEYDAPPIAVGDILCTDNSIVKPFAWPVPGKTAMGIVFYVDETQEHGWAVNLNDQSSGNLRWSAMANTDIASLNNYTSGRTAASDTSGYTNTMNIRGSATFLGSMMYPAPFSVDFNNGWYLPAAGQLRFMLVEQPRINPSLSIVGGTPFDSSWWYWSSTENSASHVWTVQDNGMMDLTIKNGTSEILRVRSVRSF